MTIRFLNIDLELVTKRKPVRLLRDLGDGVCLLHQGPAEEKGLWRTSLETARSRKKPATAMREFARMLASLSPEGRRDWEGAVRRTFDIGVEASEDDERLALAIDPEVLETAVRLGAAIAITVYRK